MIKVFNKTLSRPAVNLFIAISKRGLGMMVVQLVNYVDIPKEGIPYEFSQT
jgi:hypothetical protein